MSVGYHFGYTPAEQDVMGWKDYLGFVEQVDEFAREQKKAEAQRRLDA